MNYAEIKEYDISNGPGVRTSLFVSGCTHRCKNCFNSEAWDFSFGKMFTQEVMERILVSCAPSYISGLSVLGGEPFEEVNQRGIAPLVSEFKHRFPQKTIWCYTGYTYDTDLMSTGRVHCEVTDSLLKNIDVLVDGEFVQDLYDISLRFRGSSNQRIIDLKKSAAARRVVLWEDEKIFASHTW